MKLQPDKIDTLSITAYGPDWVAVNNQKHSESVVIGSRGELYAWGCHAFEQLETRHFEQLAQHQPELVLFGSGSRLRFAHPGLMAALINQGIGIETMDTLAACRTYNILASEGRRVIAALLIEQG